jgi:hypothetical protein
MVAKLSRFEAISVAQWLEVTTADSHAIARDKRRAADQISVSVRRTDAMPETSLALYRINL